MKKLASVLLSVGLVASMLTGCLSTGSSSKDTQAPAADTQASGETTGSDEIDYNASFELRLMTSLTGDVRSGLIDDAIAIFNEKWPNVKIVNETTGDYSQKFKLSFSSGDGYEIVYVDDLNQQTLMEGNYLMDITEDIKARGWLDNTIEGTIEFNNLRTPGKLYSAAFLMAPVVVYYNKDIFTELGVEIPKTIDEFEEILQKATDAGYIGTECGGDAYHQILWAVEGMVLNGAPKDEVDQWYYGEESTENVKNAFVTAYEHIQKWYENGYFRENFEGTKIDDIPTLFSQGKTAMTLGGDWDLGNYNASGLNVGAFVFPGFDANENPYIVNATDGAWALNADLNPTEKEAALDFIDIFYQDEYVKKWYENGFTLATLTDVSGIETTQLQKDIAEATKDTKMGFYLDNVKSGYLDYLIKETQLMIQGKYTPEQLVDSLEAEWNNK